MKTPNKYLKHYPDFERTPKAVIAAVALSLAMQLSEDDFTRATALCSEEWRALFANGIVPQKP